MVNENGDLVAIYGHKICVATKLRNPLGLDRLGEVIKHNREKTVDSNMKLEGLFMFGGVYGT
jgi:hypothetical protein